jgi:hypothetical protein
MFTEFTASTTLFDEVGTVEDWKPVASYPDYEVSDMGRVRCIKDRKGGKKAPFFPATKMSPSGRPMVTLRHSSGQKAHRVDELVLEAFSGPRPGTDYGPSSVSGDRSDVRADNLTWLKGLGRKQPVKKVRRGKQVTPPKISTEIRHGHWLGTGNVIVSIQPNQTIELTVADAPEDHRIPVSDLDDVIRTLQAARTIIDGG